MCSTGGTGPLMPIGQSGRGCWEQAVLGNDLAGGLGDEENTEGRAHRGTRYGKRNEALEQRVLGGSRKSDAERREIHTEMQTALCHLVGHELDRQM